jgi:L-fucose isomerase-like protein
MSFVNSIINNKLIEAKEIIFFRLNEIAALRLAEAKRYVAEEVYDEEQLDEVVKRNTNIVKMGRVQKIRRRIRRNKKGRIVVQKNVRRSAIKGFRLSGNSVKRIPAMARIQKARKLQRSWKTTRRAKLRRTLIKRKMSMQRRKSIGLR